jgi:hypothetical protein
VTDKRKIATADAYEPLLAGIVALLEESRRAAARAINSILTSAYWDIGRRIVEGSGLGTTGTVRTCCSSIAAFGVWCS